MEVKHVIEGPEGEVTFQGKLNPVEVRFLIEHALNDLVARGAVPFAGISSESENFIVPGTMEKQ
jgi:hypothetical protein